MPRQARIDAPGALHHIILRGIEQKLIFKDQQDMCCVVLAKPCVRPEDSMQLL